MFIYNKMLKIVLLMAVLIIRVHNNCFVISIFGTFPSSGYGVTERKDKDGINYWGPDLLKGPSWVLILK